MLAVLCILNYNHTRSSLSICLLLFVVTDRVLPASAFVIVVLKSQIQKGTHPTKTNVLQPPPSEEIGSQTVFRLFIRPAFIPCTLPVLGNLPAKQPDQATPVSSPQCVRQSCVSLPDEGSVGDAGFWSRGEHSWGKHPLYVPLTSGPYSVALIWQHQASPALCCSRCHHFSPGITLLLSCTWTGAQERGCCLMSHQDLRECPSFRTVWMGVPTGASFMLGGFLWSVSS